jgi:MFS family permease
MAAGAWSTLPVLQFLVWLTCFPTTYAQPHRQRCVTNARDRGIVNTFGAYQAYYESNLLKSSSSSSISWIGTFQGFLLIVFGIISGPVFDRGNFRTLIILGTFLVVFGMMMTSLASKYWQLFLAQGLCVGLGAGCLFLPSVGIVATYFNTKRALATGIAAAGGSVGSVIYPIVFTRLQPVVGFGWATRVIAFISLFTLTVSILTMRTRLPPSSHSRALFDRAAWRSAPFVVFSIGLFLTFIGLYIPFFYIIVYAESLGVDENLSFYLLSILNAASVFGRIIPGLLADKLGSLNVLATCSLASAVLAFAWIAIHSLGGLIVFCIFYGFFSGAVVSLPSTVIAGLVPELRLVGTWMGMSFSFAGLGLLIGNPIAGQILNPNEGKFTGGIAFSASTIMAGAVAFIGVQFLRARDVKGWKM